MKKVGPFRGPKPYFIHEHINHVLHRLFIFFLRSGPPTRLKTLKRKHGTRKVEVSKKTDKLIKPRK
jgi:hypothetical protein